MVSKSQIVCALLTASLSACSLPWRAAPPARELNLGFTLDRNQVVFTSATLDGEEGRFVFSSAAPRTLVDGARAARTRSSVHTLRLGSRFRIALRPLVADLHGTADALIGTEICRNKVVDLDYAHGLVTIRDDESKSGDMTYNGPPPSLPVLINGIAADALIDTAVPDAMIIPRRFVKTEASRAIVDLRVGDVTLGKTDVRVADVPVPRIGNRVLSRFLVTINYPSGTVSLWRYPDLKSDASDSRMGFHRHFSAATSLIFLIAERLQSSQR